MVDSKIKSFWLFFYVLLAIMFVLYIAYNQIGYQDSWILERIWVPALVFAVISLVFQIMSVDNRVVTAIGAIFSGTMYLIPGLKYSLFYGCFDSVGHYGFVESLLNLNHIPEVGYYASQYSDIPGMAVFISSSSLVMGIPCNDLFRFLFPVVYSVIPLLIYFVTKGLLDNNAQKYVLILSSFPLMGLTGFSVSATTFALLLFLLFIVILFRYLLSDGTSKRYPLLLAIIGLCLVISHGLTSLLLLIILFSILTILTLFSYKKNVKIFLKPKILCLEKLCASFFLFIAIWWSYVSIYYTKSLGGFVSAIFAGKASETGITIPNKFFEISLTSQVQLLFLCYVLDFSVAILSVIGFFLAIKKIKSVSLKGTGFLYFFINVVILTIVAIFSTQVLTGFGAVGLGRFIPYLLCFSPFLMSLPLVYIHRIAKKNRMIILFSLLLCILSFSMIQSYSYQPLVPKDESQEYLMDLRLTNTVYKTALIDFVNKNVDLFSYDSGTVAADTVTKFQIYGFADSSFFPKVIWYSPLRYSTLNWNLLLLQTSNIAGPYNEPSQNHTSEFIAQFHCNFTVVYDNGFSIVAKR